MAPMPKVRIKDLTDELGEVNLGRLRANLERAVRREVECGTNLSDGFPASTDGGGGGSGTGDPTAAALMARAQEHHDRMRVYTVGAVTALVEAVARVRHCEQQLQNLSDLEADRPITPKGCDLCTAAGILEAGEPVPWEIRGNVSGKLTRDLCLCRPHYKFVWDKEREPTPDETRHWWTTGAWKLREASA
jgi:hypothetical protein